jgi:hypothetical protein
VTPHYSVDICGVLEKFEKNTDEQRLLMSSELFRIAKANEVGLHFFRSAASLFQNDKEIEKATVWMRDNKMLFGEFDVGDTLTQTFSKHDLIVHEIKAPDSTSASEESSSSKALPSASSLEIILNDFAGKGAEFTTVIASSAS